MTSKINIFICIVCILITSVLGTIQAQTYNFTHQGLTRQYNYYEPSNLPEKAPLVFVLHGYSGSESSIKDYTQMNSIADKNKFAICYPRGTKDEWGNKFWQVGYEFHESEAVDDVDFLCELAVFLQTEHNLSSENTFVTGMSNGGDMSFLLSCKANHVFKAFAPVCGTIMKNRIEYCTAPVPILAINGDNDNTTWYNGDPDNIGEWGAYLGIPEIIERFVEVNECIDKTTESLPNTNTGDGTMVEFNRYFNGINNNEVWFYRIINGGHDWPGGSGNKDIDASEEVWKFFAKYLSSESTYIINNTNSNSFNVYPNPSNGTNICISTQTDYPATLEVINSKGKTITTKLLTKNNGETIQIESLLQKGLYLVVLTNNSNVLSRKLIVF